MFVPISIGPLKKDPLAMLLALNHLVQMSCKYNFSGNLHRLECAPQDLKYRGYCLQV